MTRTLRAAAMTLALALALAAGPLAGAISTPADAETSQAATPEYKQAVADLLAAIDMRGKLKTMVPRLVHAFEPLIVDTLKREFRKRGLTLTEAETTAFLRRFRTEFTKELESFYPIVTRIFSQNLTLEQISALTRYYAADEELDGITAAELERIQPLLQKKLSEAGSVWGREAGKRAGARAVNSIDRFAGE